MDNTLEKKPIQSEKAESVSMTSPADSKKKDFTEVINNPRLKTKFKRLVNLFQKQGKSIFEKHPEIAFGIRYRNSAPVIIGNGEPRFIIEFKNENGVIAMSTFAECLNCQAGHL